MWLPSFYDALVAMVEEELPFVAAVFEEDALDVVFFFIIIILLRVFSRYFGQRGWNGRAFHIKSLLLSLHRLPTS